MKTIVASLFVCLMACMATIVVADSLPACFAGSTVTLAPFGRLDSVETLDGHFVYTDPYGYGGNLATCSWNLGFDGVSITYMNGATQVGYVAVSIGTSQNNSFQHEFDQWFNQSYTVNPDPVLTWNAPGGSFLQWVTVQEPPVLWTSAIVKFTAYGGITMGGANWPAPGSASHIWQVSLSETITP